MTFTPKHRAAACLFLAASLAGAQTTQQTQPDAQAPPPKGKVLFERHEPAVSPDDAQPTQESAPTAVAPAAKPGVSSSNRKTRTLRRRSDEPAPADATGDALPVVVEPPADSAVSSSDGDQPQVIAITAADLAAAKRVSAAERAAVQITATDLDLHLNTHTGEAETRAQLTVRNSGETPLTRLPLRISGALKWESARFVTIGGSHPPTNAPATIEQHHLADDLDHTGVSTELVLTLPQPLAPGETAQLDLYYGGIFTANAQRLLALGAPPSRALRTDWDTVSDAFTGLRGLGNVLWYPVATPPALLKDGNAVPGAVESSRSLGAAGRFNLRLTVEYTGSRPDAAFFCGERKPLAPLDAADASGKSTSAPPAETDSGVLTAAWTRPALGPHTPSLFIASAAPHTVAGGQLRVVTDRADTTAALSEAAAKLKPMLAEWLGAAPARSLDVVDLPIPDAAGFSDGALIVAPLSTGPATSLAPSLVQPLASAWLPADVSAAWLREGIPSFLQAVWAERTAGRSAALAGLAANAASLQATMAAAKPEPSQISSSSASADGPAPSPLALCADAACARGRGAYVFEMLRTMLGDTALQGAISGWRVAMEQPSSTRTAADETATMERLLQQVAGTRKLDWFFSSWIHEDGGLPELTIVTVAPRRIERGIPKGDFLPQQRKPVAGPVGAEPVPQPGDPTYEAEHATVTPGDRIAPAVGSWLVAVEVKNTGGTDAEVPVTVRAGGLTNTLPLRVPAHGRATIRVPFEADPQEVFVNDGSVPETKTSTHRRSILSLPPER